MANACLEGNVNAVRKLLEQGWSVHDSTDEGESLLSLACSAGKICCSLSSNVLQKSVYCSNLIVVAIELLLLGCKKNLANKQCCESQVFTFM